MFESKMLCMLTNVHHIIVTICINTTNTIISVLYIAAALTISNQFGRLGIFFSLHLANSQIETPQERKEVHGHVVNEVGSDVKPPAVQEVKYDPSVDDVTDSSGLDESSPNDDSQDTEVMDGY